MTAEALHLPAEGRPWDVSPLVVDARRLTGPDGPSLLRDAAAEGHTVCAVRLPGFQGLLSHRTQPGLDFAHELAERVRVIACPEHHPFLLHSDQGSSSVDETTWGELRALLAAEEQDAIVLVWGSDNDAETAVREVLLRAQDALVGVPAETRQAHPDGTTGFERILPGPDRMYPDTDTPPLAIPDAMVDETRAEMPEAPWMREDRYVAAGVPFAAARRLSRSPWADLFDRADPPPGDTSRRLAWTLLQRMPHHARRGLPVHEVDPARLGAIVAAVVGDQVRPEALGRMVDALVRQPETTARDILAGFGPTPLPEAELHPVLQDVAGRALALEGRSGDTRLRWAMGEAMRHLLGRANPAEVEGRLAIALTSKTLVPAK